MNRRPALALLLLLAACHRGNVADVTLDADHAAENATAAKTLADITAAEEASASPIAHHVDRPVADQPAPESTAPPEADDVMSDGNSGDASPQ